MLMVREGVTRLKTVNSLSLITRSEGYAVSHPGAPVDLLASRAMNRFKTWQVKSLCRAGPRRFF
ncbi:hypothetical protein MTMN5_04183 (plasmid) [Marinobacter salarius]|jgi:hypothetical protein|nr:hypothetical protein MTMN5_04183 [Marinobacter salarius]